MRKNVLFILLTLAIMIGTIAVAQDKTGAADGMGGMGMSLPGMNMKMGMGGMSMNGMSMGPGGMSMSGMGMGSPSSMMWMMDSSGKHVMMGKTPDDNRTFIQLSSDMQAHQKAMMREHLRASQEVAALLAEGNFARASTVAHEKLGLTDEMKKMCDMFPVENYRSMGYAFHQSADQLAETIKTGNLQRSLSAYAGMMKNCVNCHDTFRLGPP